MNTVLEAEALHKRYGGLAVVDGLSLSVAAGARHAIIGPNGAGKTTLFNLLSGETGSDAGRILFEGTDITAWSADGRARAGLARSFQRNNLFPEFTVGENLITAIAIRRRLGRVFWRGLSGFPDLVGEAETVAAAVGLSEVLGNPARNLAYGMQRQLEVGLSIALEPKLLLLDEPTAGMSPEETRAMQRLVAGLPATMTILLIEHDMDVVFDMADRITVLDQGRVLADGQPDAVRTSEAVRERYLGVPA